MLWLAPLLLGCSKTEPCDSVEYICDTAAYWERQKAHQGTIDPVTGTWIEIVRRPACPNDPDLFEIGVRVRGPHAAEARADIWSVEESGGFNETHVLTGQGALNGGAEDMAAALRDEARPSQYVAGEITTYVCGQDDVDGTLTLAVRVYDASGALADCAAFSTEPDPQAAVEEALGGGREEPIEIPDRDELTLANCQLWTLPAR